MFKVGIPKEIFPNERRVAATPITVGKMLKLGVEVLLEAGAGEGAHFQDGTYAEVGARVVPTAELWAESDLILKVRPPMLRTDGKHEADLLKEGGKLISFIWPGINKGLVESLAARKATVLAMDCMPRITRAQKMDALSATANAIGYRAVIEAAAQFGRFLPGQVTAAGRVKPAQVLIIGAGVAGLAAIAAAKSLGAVVRAFDTRPAVREQVQSLGATFLKFEFTESGEGEGGYAKQMSDAYIAAEQALIAENAKDSDIVISTAIIPGVPAPKLITSGAVVSMKHGSIIVDLAAEQGGNCALTERDKAVEKFGVLIVGYTDLASRMAAQTSELYATTLFNLLADVFDSDKGDVVLDLEDEIHRGVVVLKDGELLWPPPSRPKPRSAAPQPEAAVAHKPAHPPPSKTGPIFALILALLLGAAGLYAPSEFLEHLTVFLLAVVVGWHVIWNVTPALHTPLMSVTNAISGIILIGGVLLLRVGGTELPTILAGVAVLIATINVAGGFLVTQRMLKMFRRAPAPAEKAGAR
ncbi:MAG TPA: Re/Si-specific NAD(P)(+) transhydrogenase subunit alpha [Polyangiaceae bacterium]|nr:Re/Si-specific NAD(P)(+) transhydrogenase subunit alpha [Polyangiaceae bacterium]